MSKIKEYWKRHPYQKTAIMLLTYIFLFICSPFHGIYEFIIATPEFFKIMVQDYPNKRKQND